MFRPKEMNMGFSYRFFTSPLPWLMQEVYQEGKTPQNHKEQTKAKVLFHFSLMRKQSDNLLFRHNHLQNRKISNGRRPYRAMRHTHARAHTLSLWRCKLLSKWRNTNLAKSKSVRQSETASRILKRQQDKPIASINWLGQKTVHSLRQFLWFPPIWNAPSNPLQQVPDSSLSL